MDSPYAKGKLQGLIGKLKVMHTSDVGVGTWPLKSTFMTAFRSPVLLAQGSYYKLPLYPLRNSG